MLRDKLSPVRRILLVLLLVAVPAAASAIEVRRIEGAERWQGEVVLEGPVTVTSGAVLTIAAGTVVRSAVAAAKISVQGTLRVAGNEGRPVRFETPKGWQGIEFIDASRDSIIEHARFAGAQAAISSIATPFTLRDSTLSDCATAVKLLREADPLIEDCLFADNKIAIDNEMKSNPTIRGNRFVGHTNTAILASHNSTGAIEDNLFEKNKQGIGLLQKYPDRIAGNRFIENEAGIFCNQTQSTPVISENLFRGNENGLVNYSFSYPAVENNTFTGNGTAVRNDQFGSPLLIRNLFAENETAVYNNRKSNPKIRRNHFKKNGLALFCDYSSYPTVENNNFIGNRMAVKLGIYQSADWEKRSGSKSIVQQQARSRGSQNPLLAQAPTEFSDYVDVRENWWGGDTGLLEKGGNVTIFHDRADKAEVTYEGFGPESYTIDRVVYEPWLKKPVEDAGPQDGP